MFNFCYHIPSAMVKDKWNHIPHHFDNPKIIAKAALQEHYRGSESPTEVEIWVRRRPKSNSETKIKKFKGREQSRGVYEVEHMKEER